MLYNTRQTRKAFDLLQLSQLREERKEEEKTRNGREIGYERGALEQEEGDSSGVESQGTNYTSINENCCQFKTGTSTASKAKVFERTSYQSRRQDKHQYRSWPEWKATKFIAYSHVHKQCPLLHPKSQRLPD